MKLTFSSIIHIIRKYIMFLLLLSCDPSVDHVTVNASQTCYVCNPEEPFLKKCKSFEILDDKTRVCLDEENQGDCESARTCCEKQLLHFDSDSNRCGLGLTGYSCEKDSQCEYDHCQDGKCSCYAPELTGPYCLMCNNNQSGYDCDL